MRFEAFILQKCSLKNARSLFEESPDKVIHSFICKTRRFNQKNAFSPKHIINYLALTCLAIKNESVQLLK